jgi:putative drug exporter of the RND superfamily
MNWQANKPKHDHSTVDQQAGYQVFAAIGKFSVKFRWLVVLVWIVGTVAAVHYLPSLTDATQSDNSSFLPSSAPSEKAINLASAFGKTANAAPIQVVIATKDSSTLSTADLNTVSSLQAKLSTVNGVDTVRNTGQSNDGQADELVVLVKGGGNTNPTPLIDSIRAAINKVSLPSNLQVHLAGQVADSVDSSKKSGATDTQIQIGSIIFIILLLLVIFRAPLAPLITLLPAALVVVLSGPIIAEVAKHGLKVSSLSQLLLTVLVLGAGTDYGLFLIFRVREEMQSSLPAKEAVVRAVSRVGESITFSAATVVVALLSLTFATFQLYSTLGVPLAIGIGLMLIAGLTLLPALLAIFGRATFWPSKKYKPTSKKGGLWGRLASAVIQRPVPVLLIGVLVFGLLAVSVVHYKSGGFGSTTAAATGTDSAEGDSLLTKHYPSNSSNPTEILFVLPQTVWQNPKPLQTIQDQLSKAPEFTSVEGPLDFNGVKLPPEQLSAWYKQFGPPSTQPMTESKTATMSAASVAQAREFRIYNALANFIAPDGRTVQFAADLTAGNPSTTPAIDATTAVRARVQQVAESVHASNNGVVGEAPALYDVSTISNNDLKKVIPIAIIVIGLLLAVLLRSLIAPLYLIISVALSYLASLGLSVLIFMDIKHESGLTFILPFLMFIFLLALGEDYNILVMTRIREEAHGLPLRQAVSQALKTTGTTVTSAGLVLAGTFTVFAVVGGNGSTEIRDIGFGLALGILMDTFIVRTLIVPATVVLLGRWNWWPTKHGSWISDED